MFYLILHTLFASCLFTTMLIPLWTHAWCKQSKHVQLNKTLSQLLVLANSETCQA